MMVIQAYAAVSVVVLVLSLTLCAGISGVYARYGATYPSIYNSLIISEAEITNFTTTTYTPTNTKNDAHNVETETQIQREGSYHNKTAQDVSPRSNGDAGTLVGEFMQKHIRQSETGDTVYFVIGTRFFKDVDPKKLSTGAHNAYTGKCELLLRIAAPSVMLAVDEYYAQENIDKTRDNVRIRWQFDSDLMMHDATCAAAVEFIKRRFANHTQNYKRRVRSGAKSLLPETKERVLQNLDTVTNWEGVHFGDYREDKVFDIARQDVLIMSRFDSDDAINRIALKHIINGIRGVGKTAKPISNHTDHYTLPGSVRDTGFYYVSLPDTANFAVKHGGPCGSLTRCDYCLHKGLMQTYAIYGPKLAECSNRTDYSNCLHAQRLSMYTFPHSKVNEHFKDNVVQHFPKCKQFDQCRSYLCGDGSEAGIKPDGGMKLKLKKACPVRHTPMALYTQSGLQDSAESPSAWNATAAVPSLRGTAVCSVLRDLFGIEFPILEMQEPALARCLTFEHRNDPECVR